MTACILHPDDEHPPEPGWQTCWRARDRMAAALRDIPELVDELADHERHMERDWGLRVPDGAVQWPNTRKEDVAVPGRDPVANVLTAGPVNGARSGPRVMSSGERSLPIRIDPTDLLAPARPASLAIADTGLYAADQIGHLAVATELEFWARDWADARGEHCPMPTVPVLAAWLLDRLDWACQHHLALDEFAGKLRSLRSSLTAAAGRFDAPTELLAAPCPGCRDELLYRDTDLECIACGGCPVLLSDEAYAEHARALVAVRLDEESAFPTAER